jgi:hypothetical protein
MQILRVFIGLFLIGCSDAPSSIKNKEAVSNNTHQNNEISLAGNYDRYKKNSQKMLTLYKNDPNTFNEQQLLKSISDSLLPCWYGTSWDFNGTTKQPQKGSIACGYFVTTVLQDIGLQLNISKLAQCASSILIKHTCSGISKYSNKSLGHFVSEIKLKGPGLYIAGLDFHTGFILNNGNDVYFIHSTYYTPKCVIKERAIESFALRNSKFRMIGKVNF